MNRKKELHLSSIKQGTHDFNTREEAFSYINNWYNNTTKKGNPIKQYLSLQGLKDTLNSVRPNTAKDNAPTILKGIYENGTSGEYAKQGSPYLFFDIDAKDNKAWAYDKAKNAYVFEFLQKYSLLTWRSYSGTGMAGIFYCKALSNFNHDSRNFHKQLAELLYNHVKKIIFADSGLYVNFDSAQAKFRQVRYLAHQKEDVEINKDASCFHAEFEIKAASFENGLPKYIFSRDVIGSIQAQFNNSNPIENILQNYGYSILSNGRVKSPTTEASSSGFIKDNKLVNFSSSSGKKRNYSPFQFILEHQYFDDKKAFLSDLKKQGYTHTQPEVKKLIDGVKHAKKNKDIANLCYDYKYLKYEDKIKTISKLETEKKKVVSTYLGLKKLEVKPDFEYEVENYVGEVISKVLDNLDKNEKIILKAETGIGKTTAILKYAKKLRPNKRFLICVPLVSIARQIANEYEEVIALTEASDLNDHSNARRGQIIVATYENASNHLKNKNIFDYIVIDEAHNMFNANSYKSKTISKLALLIQDKRVLGLTATPNALFQKVGYKIANIKINRPKTEIIQRVYSGNAEKVIIDHIKNTTRKLIIRLNSKNKLKHLRSYLINTMGYKEEEVLFLYSGSDIKESKEFLNLTQKGEFPSDVKIVLTTSVIDEGLSIRQGGFDTIFIENNYFLSPESVKQFTARFRNSDNNRKNYYYILKKKNQDFKNTSLQKCFDFFQLEDLDAFSKFKSLLNQNAQYLEDFTQSKWYRGNEAFKMFVSNLNLKEYNFYIENNFNLKVIIDLEFNQKQKAIKEIKTSILNDKDYFNDIWINNKKQVFKVLHDTDTCLNSDLTKDVSLMDNDIQKFNEFVIFNIEKYKKLDYFFFQLRKYFDNPDTIMIKDDKIVYSTKINNEILYQETKELLKAPIVNKTDAKHKKTLQSILENIYNKEEFTKEEIQKVWKKNTKVKYNHQVILRIISDYFKMDYDKRKKKFKVYPTNLFNEFEPEIIRYIA
jgi:hypothetical protein